MSCEKCWGDAFARQTGNQAEEYFRLLEERKDNPCTPEQQAGQWWDPVAKEDARDLEAHERATLARRARS